MAWTTPRTWVDSEFLDDTIMNAHIRDNLAAIGEHQIVRKVTHESRTNTTTLAADSELLLPVGASQTWEWELVIWVSCSSDFFKFRVAAPSASTGSYFGFNSESNPNAPFSSAHRVYTDTVSAGAAFTETGVMNGILVTSVTAGDLVLEWAQVTSGSNAATVQAGSYIKARRVA